VVRTLEESQAGATGGGPLMVIGGAEVYRLCLPQTRRIHLTLVHTQIEDGDTFFSAWRAPDWIESSRERHEADEKNAYAFSFLTLDRV
jgi:dihydrofolate reductase